MRTELDQFVDAYRGGTPFDGDNDLMLRWYSQRFVTLDPTGASSLELGLHTISGNDSEMRGFGLATLEQE